MNRSKESTQCRRAQFVICSPQRRDVNTFGSLQVNNFFLFIVLIVYAASQSGVEPKSAYPFLLLMLIVMLFPLSSDPLEKVPASRRARWPLSSRQKTALRVASVV